MKYIQSLSFLAILILAGAVTEISAQTYAGGKNSMQGVEQKVFKKLIGLPFYGVFDHITFKVEGETVTLYGKVADARNKKDAENAVERIEGVREVVNRIETLPPSPFDDRIRIRILRTLAARGGLFRYLQEPNPSVRLIVDGGHVTLEGYVANRGDYNVMNVLVNGVTDVFSVKNNLLVEKELPR